jgi:hypothetical protein
LASTEPPVEGAEDASGTEPDASTEDISMEDVLGAGTRKQPAAAKEEVPEVPQVETQTF